MVSFVPATGAPAMYRVEAFVVVTVAFVAARVGGAIAAKDALAAVPEGGVLLSVKVWAPRISCEPAVPGVPEAAPLVRVSDLPAPTTLLPAELTERKLVPEEFWTAKTSVVPPLN